ncbi:hypothetical protein FKM82_005501 [Ascaphus truei]
MCNNVDWETQERTASETYVPEREAPHRKQDAVKEVSRTHSTWTEGYEEQLCKNPVGFGPRHEFIQGRIQFHFDRRWIIVYISS